MTTDVAMRQPYWIFAAFVVAWCAIWAQVGVYIIDTYEPNAESCVALGAVIFAGVALPIEAARRRRSS